MTSFFGANHKRKRGFGKIRLFSTLPSTNDLLKEKGESLPTGSVFIAKGQSKGKGRTGKSFISPKGKGLYMSYLFKPNSPEELNNLTPKTALVVMDSIKAVCGIESQIKWVNDILFEGKKLCGILTEVKKGYAVIGIGLNVLGKSEDFPPEIAKILTTLEEISGKKFSIKKLALEIIARLDNLDSYSTPYSRYKKHCVTVGKKVEIISGNQKYNALVLSLNEDFSLTVKKEGGGYQKVNSGEVSIKEY